MTNKARCRKSKNRQRIAKQAGAALWTLALLAGASPLLGCGSERDLEGQPLDFVGDPAVAPATDSTGATEKYDARSVIVRFKPVTGAASQRSVQATTLARIGATFLDRNGDGVYDRFANVDPSGRMMKLDLPASTTVEAALAALRKDPAVLYAEPNYRLHATGIPNDPRFPQLYNMHNTGQTGGTRDADVDAPEAWNLTTGSRNVVVAVVDSGIDYHHEDLAANMWVNPHEIAGNGLDDDDNGVIDDVHGANLLDGSGDPMDENSHGTHCAGIVGAVGDNGVGVAGVAWNVSLMAIKFLDATAGGTLEGAVASLDYALGMKNAGVNLRVLSNSWAGGDFFQSLYDAIEATNAAGMLFVASSANNFGNDNDVNPVFPSSYDNANILSAAATDHDDEVAAFSNIGPTTVDLAAPGDAVLSTVLHNGYGFKSGTSMSTPLVAGAAALLLSVRPSLTTAEVKELLMSSGDELPSLAGLVLSGRRLNVFNALAAIDPPELAIERILRNHTTFEFVVDLSWTNADGRLVDLYRNDGLVDIPANDGAHRDVFRRYETSFTWKLCESQSTVCSNEVSVVFGSASLGKNGEPTEATITGKRADGSTISRVVKIVDVD
jgi:serine protease